MAYAKDTDKTRKTAIRERFISSALSDARLKPGSIKGKALRKKLKKELNLEEYRLNQFNDFEDERQFALLHPIVIVEAVAFNMTSQCADNDFFGNFYFKCYYQSGRLCFRFIPHGEFLEFKLKTKHEKVEGTQEIILSHDWILSLENPYYRESDMVTILDSEQVTPEEDTKEITPLTPNSSSTSTQIEMDISHPLPSPMEIIDIPTNTLPLGSSTIPERKELKNNIENVITSIFTSTKKSHTTPIPTKIDTIPPPDHKLSANDINGKYNLMLLFLKECDQPEDSTLNDASFSQLIDRWVAFKRIIRVNPSMEFPLTTFDSSLTNITFNNPGALRAITDNEPMIHRYFSDSFIASKFHL
jgi:hypothetical protein